MPLNEARRKPLREHYPLQFDLEGLPRDRETRDRALRDFRLEELMPVNKFAVDKLAPEDREALLQELLSSSSGGTREFDFNNPPKKPYTHQPYPRMVYHHEDGRVLTVQSEEQHKTAMQRGFKNEPSLHFDYSKIQNGRAAPRHHVEEPAAELSAEQLEELEAGEQENEQQHAEEAAQSGRRKK